MTLEEFIALPACETWIDEPDERGVIVRRMIPYRMVWIEENEPHGWIIDGYYWTKMMSLDGTLVRVRGRLA